MNEADRQSYGASNDGADDTAIEVEGTVSQVGAPSSCQSTYESNAKNPLQPLRAQYHTFPIGSPWLETRIPEASTSGYSAFRVGVWLNIHAPRVGMLFHN